MISWDGGTTLTTVLHHSSIRQALQLLFGVPVASAKVPPEPAERCLWNVPEGPVVVTMGLSRILEF